jgi:hypothetical protein
MNWGGPEFVIAIIAIGTFGGIMKSWVRAKHGLPPEELRPRGRKYAERDAGEVARLEAENKRLTGQLEAYEDRLIVLEKIVTDRGYTLANEIEALRDREPKLENRSETL